MSMLNLMKTPPKTATLETLIEGLDQRGLLVLQVLLGQKAMEILALEKLSSVSLVDSNKDLTKTGLSYKKDLILS